MKYRLLDSGDGRKLERLGDVLVERQAAQAFWRPRLDPAEWKKAKGVHIRSDKGGGHWQWRTQPPESWTVEHGGAKFKVKPTPFGHVGLFAEQAEQWQRMREILEAAPAGTSVLNLFAYTGGSTLACAGAGAAVTHVDAAAGVVSWARENAELNGLSDRPVRWIVDDVRKFVEREVRRGNRYQGLILDPPTFGRGAKGETWQIEEHLAPLLDHLSAIMEARPLFILLSGHSPGFTGLVYDNLLGERFDRRGYDVDRGEMTVNEEAGQRPLPSGTYCRWRRTE